MNKAHRLASAAPGFALIEVILAIVLIAIMASVVFSQTSAAAAGSAATVIAAEADSVAASYLELVSSRAFDDPDGIDGETARADFDDVDDYDGIVDSGARDAAGAVIAGLAALTVRVSVSGSAALNGVPATDVKRIDVTVTDRAGARHIVTAYRLRP